MELTRLLAWEGFFLGRKLKYRVLQAIVHAIFWILWIQRTRRVFDGVETKREQLKDKWLRTLFIWRRWFFAPLRLILLTLWIALGL